MGSEIVNFRFYSCPECPEVFIDEQSVFEHTSMVHYWKNLSGFFTSRVMLDTNNFCVVCGRSAEMLTTVACYIQHMCKKHRDKVQFNGGQVWIDHMKVDGFEKKALNEEANQLVVDHEEEVVGNNTSSLNTAVHTLSSPPVFPGQLPHVISYKSLNDGNYQLSTFNALVPEKSQPHPTSSQSVLSDVPLKANFQSPKTAKKNKGRSLRSKNDIETSPASKISFDCPECCKTFTHVSSLYIHSAMRHHSQSLSKLYKERYLLSDEKCNICDHVITKSTTYILHLGGKHKLIHNLMSPDLLSEYQKLPSKKLYSGYVKSKSEPLLCLLCSNEKKFSNITKYKQHLAIYHFRKRIEESYMKTNQKELTCHICSAFKVTKSFSKPGTLILHLGAVHNFVLNFADDSLRKQLESYIDQPNSPVRQNISAP